MTLTPQPSYIVLEPNVPVTVKVTAARQEDREVRDPISGQMKPLNVFILEVSEVNNQPRKTSVSFTSFKAQTTLAPLVNSGQIYTRKLEIVRRPRGFATDYEFRLL